MRSFILWVGKTKKQTNKRTKRNVTHHTNKHIPFSVIHTYKLVDFVVPLVGRRAVAANRPGIVVVVHKQFVQDKYFVRDSQLRAAVAVLLADK